MLITASSNEHFQYNSGAIQNLGFSHGATRARTLDGVCACVLIQHAICTQKTLW
jgi:hypothetical protein